MYSFKDTLTVAQFQDLQDLEGIDNIATKSAMMVSIVTGEALSEIRTWHKDKMNKIGRELAMIDYHSAEKNVQRHVRINGKKIRLETYPTELTAGQLIDVIETMKGINRPIAVMHKVLAILSMPDTYNINMLEERSKEMLQVPVLQVWGVWVFFYNVWKRYIADTEDYLDKQMTKTIQRAKQILEKDGRGL